MRGMRDRRRVRKLRDGGGAGTEAEAAAAAEAEPEAAGRVDKARGMGSADISGPAIEADRRDLQAPVASDSKEGVSSAILDPRFSMFVDCREDRERFRADLAAAAEALQKSGKIPRPSR
jgi:hypothetical protein